MFRILSFSITKVSQFIEKLVPIDEEKQLNSALINVPIYTNNVQNKLERMHWFSGRWRVLEMRGC
jgi:hypothetical protein